MARYIDSDQLYNAVEQRYRMSSGIEHRCERDLLDLICEQPTISPDEVRGVGKWIRISGYHLDREYHPARYQCDQCKHFIDSGDDRNYCPNCGAKMKGAEDGTTD